YLGLVAHAQRAARHFHAGACAAQDAVVAFLGQLLLVHLGRRRHPKLGGDVALAFQQLGCGAEVADIGHAAADEDFVNDRARDIGQRFNVVGIVGACHDGLVHVGQVDFNDGGVFGIGIGLDQLRVLEPGLHGLDAAAQRALVFIAIGDQDRKSVV